MNIITETKVIKESSLKRKRKSRLTNLCNEYGQRTSQTYGNGVVQTYTYDEKTKLLSNFISKDKNDNELLNYNYTFDKAKNITNITTTTTGDKTIQDYYYDLMGRLTSANGACYNLGTANYMETYTYDNANRIVTKVGNDMRMDYHYNSGTHSISYIEIAGDVANNKTSQEFIYDDYGNLKTKKTYAAYNLSNTETYTYNDGDELSHIDQGNGFSLDFSYDVCGQRIKKVYSYTNTTGEVNIQNENIYVNGFYSINKTGTSENVQKHISDGYNIIATKIDNDQSKIHYYTQNHIGSTAMLTDEYGNKVQRNLFKPYGEIWVSSSTETIDTNRLFTGQEYDTETKMYYMNARYYDPSLAVFISPDPAMSGSNHYSYADCNPIRYNDPTGLTADNEQFGITDEEANVRWGNPFSNSSNEKTVLFFYDVNYAPLVYEADRIYKDQGSLEADASSNTQDSVVSDNSSNNKNNIFQQTFQNISNWYKNNHEAMGLAIMTISAGQILAGFGIGFFGDIGGGLLTATGFGAPAGILVIAGATVSGTSLIAGGAISFGLGLAVFKGNGNGKEKGEYFRGGKKNDRDNWYGYNNKDFQRWWHREGKDDFGGKDIMDSKMAEEAYNTWVNLGKPIVRK
jgi:RHS repeat-associated protein